MAADVFADLSTVTDDNDLPIPGGKWKFYDTGTSTPRNVYASPGGASLGSVVTADGDGRFPAIYFDAAYLYRAVLTDASDVTIKEIDPANAGVNSLLIDLASIVQGEGSGLIGYYGGTTVENELDAINDTIADEIEPHLARYIDVLDYGAVGDGVTNDAGAIQAAVDAAPDGSVVIFSAGEYGIGSGGLELNGRAGVTLLGLGGKLKLLANASGTIVSFASTSIRLIDCTGCGLRGLEIDGNAKASNPVGFENGTECFAEGNTIYGADYAAMIVAAGGGSGNRFVNNICRDGVNITRGMWLGNTTAGDMESDILVYGNTVKGNAASGLVVGANGGRVIGNHCETNEGAGIVIPGANSLASSDMVVSGNTCIDNLYHGIQFDSFGGASESPNNITVTGNICNRNNRGTGSGIYVVHSLNCVISGNVCLDNVVAGIIADDDNIGLVIASNMIGDTRSGGSRSQELGIRVNITTDDSSDYTISGNVIRNHIYDGIQVNAGSGMNMTGLALTGNTIGGNSRWGVKISETDVASVTGVSVGGNAIHDNTTFDINAEVNHVVYDGNNFLLGNGTGYASFANGDTTPSVANLKYWRASNSAPTSITNFDDEYDGQEIVIRATTNFTTIVHDDTNIVLSGSANASMSSNDIITLVKQSSTWYEVSRNF